jgi:hypothetical protein
MFTGNACRLIGQNLQQKHFVTIVFNVWRMEQVAHGEQIIAENCLLLNPDRKTIII